MHATIERSGERPRATTAGSLARRMPLSLAMVAVTTVLAIATGALSGGTPASTVERFGYSLDNLRAGRLYVLPSSDWLVYGVRHWSSMLLLFALFAAPLELRGGTALLATAFWLGSWGGTIATSLMVASLGGPLDWHPHPDLVHEADVGGSVGAWSCAGALAVLIAGWPGWIVWPARIGAGAYLGYRFYAVHGAADVAHGLGFLIGSCVGVWSARTVGAAAAVDA
jgi:hypothetical protein